jgi:hypothetical protein
MAASGRGESLAIAAPYFLFLAAIGGYGLAISPKLTISQLVEFWLINNTLPTLLMLGFLRQRVKAVGPLILTFMVAGLAGAWLANDFVLRNSTLFASLYSVFRLSEWGLGIDAVLWSAGAVGCLFLAVADWWLLRRVGEAAPEEKN